RLHQQLGASKGQLALETLWALNLCGGFNEKAALQALEHAEPQVRLWSVRLLGDANAVTPAVARKLADLARTEAEVEVRAQLAGSARRLPAADALPIARHLLCHAEDAADIHQPLLLWWALESKCASNHAAVLALFEDAALWRQRLVE